MLLRGWLEVKIIWMFCWWVWVIVCLVWGEICFWLLSSVLFILSVISLYIGYLYKVEKENEFDYIYIVFKLWVIVIKNEN